MKSIDQKLEFNQLDRDAYVKRVAATVPQGSRVLDVGAGEGRYRDYFSHCRYETQDLKQYEGTKQGLHQETWHYTKLDYVSDITAIPVKDASFDFVLCTEVLEHVSEPIKAIKEMARILKSGGRILLTAPLGSGLHQKPYHFYGGFTPYFYEKFMGENGLRILEIKPNGGFLKYFSQESARVAEWLVHAEHLGKWSLKKRLLRFVFRTLIPAYCLPKDAEYFLEDFTVGYFVLAEKSNILKQ